MIEDNDTEIKFQEKMLKGGKERGSDLEESYQVEIIKDEPQARCRSQASTS